MFIFFQRQTECKWGGGGQTERETRALKQAPSSKLEPHVWLELTDCEIVT